MTLQAVAVENIKVGDLVQVGTKTGKQVVSEITRYEDNGESRLGDRKANGRATYVVWYFLRGEATWENKARARRGRLDNEFLTEKMLAPLLAGDLLMVEAGDPKKAAELRREMEREQARRAAQAEARWR